VLATCLNTFMLYFLITGITGSKPRAFLAAGLLAGLSATGNASILAFAGVATLFMLLAGGGRFTRRVRMCAIFAAGVAAVVLPITIRNAAVGGDFVPVTSNAGLNLYIGNHEASTGAYVKPEGLDVFTDPEGRTIAEAAAGRELKPSEVSAWWAGRARRYISENPGRFGANLLRKAFFFWSVYEVPQIEHLAFEKRYSALLRIPSPSFGIICPLGVMGIILALKRKKSAQLLFLYVLTYSLTIISFFVVARYRLPMVPALMVFAALTITWLVRAGVSGEYRKMAPVVIGIALLILAVNINFYGVDPLSGYAQSYYRLGIIYGLKGKPAEALDSYRQALALDPEIVPARVGAGILLSQAGEYREAKMELLRAVDMDSTYEKGYYNLGLVYSEEGRPDSALMMMQKALEIQPGYVLARVGVASALYELGDLNAAGPLLASLRRDPGLPQGARNQVNFLLGFLPSRQAWLAGRDGGEERLSDFHLLRGDIMVSILLMDRALAEYEEAIRIDPRSAAAYYQEGTVYFRRGDLDRTLESLERALAAGPGYEGANLAVGIIKARKEDYAAACSAFEAELRVNPASPDAHMNLAVCYERHLIDIERAVYHLEKYVELTGGNPDIETHIQELKAEAR
jgi:tetratricopeptide (TPR) repeat protein